MSTHTVSRLGENVSGVDRETLASVAGVTGVTVSTVLMLQSMRVFVSYMVFVIDQSNRTTLVTVAAGVFLASGLSWIFIRFLGVRTVIVASTVLLALSRLSFQFWENPVARLWLGAIAIISWGWLFFAMVVTRRDQVALGASLGLALDLGIRIAFKTVDLPWMPGISADVISVLLVGALLVSISFLDFSMITGGSRLMGSVSLLAIGPAFTLYHLVTGNLGLAQARLGLSFPGAAVVLAFGMAVGVLVSALRCSGEIALLANTRWWYIWRLGLALAVALGIWSFWIGAFLGPAGLMLGVAASVMLSTELLLGSVDAVTPIPSGWSALYFTLGLLIEVGLLFAYYTFSGSPRILVAVVAIFLITCLAGAPARSSVQQARGVSMVLAAGVLGALLLLISAWEVVSWNDASTSAAIGPDITVMTYNIQSGFSATHQFDLDATANVIAAQHPDIVVLQEVSRGWLVTSGIDEVVWLSQRLKMNYAFGSNSDDGLWGNIILSRAPIESTRTVQYSVTQNLKRSVIEVQLRTQSGDLWVLGTHLDDPRDAGQVRLQQASELISTWNRHSPAIVMGDMNSDPNDPVITQFRSAGLVDYGEPFISSDYTSHDRRRIDYIFGTDNIALRSTNVPNVWTSDHRPVVAHLTLPPD